MAPHTQQCPLCEEAHAGPFHHAEPPGVAVCEQCLADLEIYLGGDGIPTPEWIRRVEALCRRPYKDCRRSWLEAIVESLERSSDVTQGTRRRLDYYRRELEQFR